MKASKSAGVDSVIRRAAEIQARQRSRQSPDGPSRTHSNRMDGRSAASARGNGEPGGAALWPCASAHPGHSTSARRADSPHLMKVPSIA
jgi:hypothetical protein